VAAGRGGEAVRVAGCRRVVRAEHAAARGVEAFGVGADAIGRGRTLVARGDAGRFLVLGGDGRVVGVVRGRPGRLILGRRRIALGVEVGRQRGERLAGGFTSGAESRRR